MSWFWQYTGFIPASEALLFGKNANRFGRLREEKSVETLEFSCVVSYLSPLERDYEKKPLQFLQAVLSKIQWHLGHKEFYKQCCKTIISSHAYNYLAWQSLHKQIPVGRSAEEEVSRLEFKMLFAKLYQKNLLEKCTYQILQEECPELFCPHEFVDEALREVVETDFEDSTAKGIESTSEEPEPASEEPDPVSEEPEPGRSLKDN